MWQRAAKIVKRAGFWLVVLLIFFYILFPIYWTLQNSLKTPNQLVMTPITFIPRDPDTMNVSVSFQSYAVLFRSEAFFRGIRNSLIVAGTTTLLSLIISSFGAFAISKLRFKGRKPSMYLILSMTMFPQIAVLTGVYRITRTLGLTAIPSMILSYLMFTLPFSTWVLIVFLRGLPHEIFQAALVDGASLFQAFRRILLPLSAPALFTTGVLTFINAWNEYMFALLFTAIEPDARTVPVTVAFFGATLSSQQMAANIVVTLPAIILVALFQKRITEGLTGGALNK